MKHHIRPWGKLPTGEQVDLITLESESGVIAEISNFGGIIRSLIIPLSSGEARQVVLGHENLTDYLVNAASIGVTVGPFANRIRGARFTLDGINYRLEQNEGQNSLHSAYLWQRKAFTYEIANDALHLYYKAPDGEGGFPSNRDVRVSFSFADAMSLRIDYLVKTDHPTVISMTNHSYFTLLPDANALAHKLQIQADAYTAVDAELLPTGELISVTNSAFDFRTMRPIAQHFDHNFALIADKQLAAVLTAPDDSLSMAVHTDLPGIQLYTAEFIPTPFPVGAGICLETQHFPDAPNIPHFPSATITPEKPFVSQTTFAFYE